MRERKDNLRERRHAHVPRVQSRAFHVTRFQASRRAPRAARAPRAPRAAVNWCRLPGLKSRWARRPSGRHKQSRPRRGAATVFAAATVTLASCGDLVYCGGDSAARQHDRAQGHAVGAWCERWPRTLLVGSTLSPSSKAGLILSDLHHCPLRAHL